MDESSIAVGKIIFPISFIDGTILPDLFPFSISFLIFPMAFIDVSIFKDDRAFKLGIGIIKLLLPIIDEFAEFFHFLFGIFAAELRNGFQFGTFVKFEIGFIVMGFGLDGCEGAHFGLFVGRCFR